MRAGVHDDDALVLSQTCEVPNHAPAFGAVPARGFAFSYTPNRRWSSAVAPMYVSMYCFAFDKPGVSALSFFPTVKFVASENGLSAFGVFWCAFFFSFVNSTFALYEFLRFVCPAV
jgi:hypothetical protein